MPVKTNVNQHPLEGRLLRASFIAAGLVVAALYASDRMNTSNTAPTSETHVTPAPLL